MVCHDRRENFGPKNKKELHVEERVKMSFSN